jgi:hypothetical protein
MPGTHRQPSNMEEAMHLGILTGGGDVPGLNSAIKAVVNEATIAAGRVTGFRRGWAGPRRDRSGQSRSDAGFPFHADARISCARSTGPAAPSCIQFAHRPSRMKLATCLPT